MTETYRKLFRSGSERRIAGVCGGIAQYLNIDPSVVRIIFLLALLSGGLGFWAYIIVWIIAPEDGRDDYPQSRR
ncbi:MAG: PspC domain-containing protein [Bacteroidales bacterium]|nr:PspC domain-containing protein [Bacteroidales bacterium]